MTKQRVLHGCRIQRAYIFTPRRDRVLANFRTGQHRYFLAVVLANAEQEVVLNVLDVDYDDNLAVILAQLGIKLTPDIEANKPARILITLAHRINAAAKTAAYKLSTPSLAVTTRPRLDTEIVPGISPYEITEIRPESRPAGAMVWHDAKTGTVINGTPDIMPETVFGSHHEFDLMIRADGSAVGHRNDWPEMLKSTSLSQLGVWLGVGQNGTVYIERGVHGGIDEEIEEMDEEKQKQIARAGYLKVLAGWDVIKDEKEDKEKIL